MPACGDSHPDYPALFWNQNSWELRRVEGKSKETCGVAYCRNPIYIEYRPNGKGGFREVRHLTCVKCRYRRWRANNPLKAAFKDIRHCAKTRRIPFSLTLDHFREICEKSGYLNFRGVKGLSLQIDRIDACKGYEDGNVAVITCSENAAKSNRERHLPEHVREMKRRKAAAAAEMASADCPF